MVSLLIFFLILSVLVLIHEFGHFVVAKKNNVFVEEFGFGLPPRVFGVKIGETIYSLNWLPFGGFVKVLGEEYAELKKGGIPEKLKNRTFVAKKPGQKIAIIVAGVAMNLLLGVFIYYFLLSTHNFQSEPLPVFTKHDFTFGSQEGRVVVIGTQKDTPAQKAKIESGDIVLQFKTIEKNTESPWRPITSADQLIKSIKDAQDIKVLIQLENAATGAKKTVEVVPFYSQELKRPIIGVQLSEAVVLKYQSGVDKTLSGFLHSYNIVEYNAASLSHLIGSAFKEKSFEPVSQTVSGPVGIFKVVDEVVKTSKEKLVVNLLNLLALMSLSLAVMNILPFPALDGGRLALVVYEWVSRKKVNPKIEQRLNLAGFAVLISFIILISINDVIRFFVK